MIWRTFSERLCEVHFSTLTAPRKRGCLIGGVQHPPECTRWGCQEEDVDLIEVRCEDPDRFGGRDQITVQR